MYLIKLLDQPFQLFALERFTICFISHWSKRLHGARKFPVTVDFNSEHLYGASLILTAINYDPARCVYFPPPSTCIFSYIKYFLGEIKIFFWSMFGFSSKRFLDNLREKKIKLEVWFRFLWWKSISQQKSSLYECTEECYTLQSKGITVKQLDKASKTGVWNCFSYCWPYRVFTCTCIDSDWGRAVRSLKFSNFLKFMKCINSLYFLTPNLLRKQESVDPRAFIMYT